MPLEESTYNELADELYKALQTGDPIDPPAQAHHLDIGDAYEVQSRFIDRRFEEEGPIVGHKIGLTSDGIQEQLGVNEPDFGRLLDSMRIEGDQISAADFIAPRIEPEIGFMLERELVPPVSPIDVLASTRFVVPVLEIIDSRIRDWNIDLEDTIADNASSAAFAVGNRCFDPRTIDLSLEAVKLWVNGEVVDEGSGAAVLGQPAEAVAWLAEALDEYGERLGAGDLVLSGSMTPAVDIESDDVVVAEFSTLGTLVLGVE